MPEVALEGIDELGQLVGRVGVPLGCRRCIGVVLGPGPSGRREPGEPRLPVLCAIDPGLVPDPLPSGESHDLAVFAASRDVGEQIEQVAATQTAPVDVEQIEQEARHQPFGDERAGTSVPGQSGGGEMMFDEARIRTVARPDDRHSGKVDAGPSVIDHDPHGVAHLVVGVGGRDHDRRP